MLGLLYLCPARGAAPISIGSRRFSVPLVDSNGQIISRHEASAVYFTEDLGGGVGLDVAVVPGGIGQIGSADPSGLELQEHPVHPVAINAFGLGVFPVTRGQWQPFRALP